MNKTNLVALSLAIVSIVNIGTFLMSPKNVVPSLPNSHNKHSSLRELGFTKLTATNETESKWEVELTHHPLSTLLQSLQKTEGKIKKVIVTPETNTLTVSLDAHD